MRWAVWLKTVVTLAMGTAHHHHTFPNSRLHQFQASAALSCFFFYVSLTHSALTSLSYRLVGPSTL